LNCRHLKTKLVLPNSRSPLLSSILKCVYGLPNLLDNATVWAPLHLINRSFDAAYSDSISDRQSLGRKMSGSSESTSPAASTTPASTVSEGGHDEPHSDGSKLKTFISILRKYAALVPACAWSPSRRLLGHHPNAGNVVLENRALSPNLMG
jgi:hypothetical protein